ncbi:hypothetical protein VTJ83DRAFT_1274 [Remersonia thermophila]|uniref:Cytoplasmic tRNA 2-thiolation protein 2 n=1 Tax=Remersonia thermophila TaxID=72144 RepID=A0ABR4DNK3_9PEZI
MTESKSNQAALTRPCVKCRAQEATLDSRSQPVCRDCFVKFISTKFIKQIDILGKKTRPAAGPSSGSSSGGPPTLTRRYLLGLSFGVSSTVLLHVLSENLESQLAKGRTAPFDLIVVHVDASSSLSREGADNSEAAAAAAEAVLNRYRARYPRFTFHNVPLSSSSSSTQSGNDSSEDALSLLSSSTTAPPTAASQSDLRAHRIRRILLASAARHNCQALLLGHSTTALAELTLAEAAKGRGFALPWLVGDGPAPPAPPSSGPQQPQVLVHHPLREALRKELVTYASLITDPSPLTDLISEPMRPGGDGTGSAEGTTTVVSYRDLSIEDVMTRYFAEVEASYPSVVANVARTAGKLVRRGGSGRDEEAAAAAAACELCGMPRDEDGDKRWRGELGIQEEGEQGTEGFAGQLRGRLCYGCERSVGG